MSDGAEACRGVARLCDILDYVAEMGPRASMRGLGADLSVPRSTAYDLLKLLTRSAFLERDENGGLRLGRAVDRLAFAYLKLGAFAELVDPVLRALQDRTGETAQISVLDRGQVLVVHVVGGPRAMRVMTEVGRRIPVNWTAAGRVLTTEMGRKQLDYFLTAGVRPSPTGRAVVQPQQLKAEIRRAHAEGHFVECNQASEHAGTIAAPVIDASGHRRAAVCLEAPEARLEANCRPLVAAVKEAARQLSLA